MSFDRQYAISLWQNNDVDGFINYCTGYARAGDSEAMEMLENFYSHGTEHEKTQTDSAPSDGKGLEYFVRQAAKGNEQARETVLLSNDPIAYYKLGTYYEAAHETLHALEMYEMALSLGYIASAKRADFLRSAVRKSKEILEQAKHGNPRAQYDYGVCCEEGRGVNKNLDEAFSWYKRAAYNGNVKAQYRMAQYYENGEGGMSDIRNALFWYNEAISQKKPYSVALYRLYEIYSEGILVGQSPALANEYLIAAAENGYTVAAYLLSENYFLGQNGYERNIEKAAYYCLKAAQCNHKGANTRIADMLKRAQSGDAEAQFFAWAYYTHKDKDTSSQAAFDMLKSSAANGYAPACTVLTEKYGIMPMNAGMGLPEDDRIKLDSLMERARSENAQDEYELGLFAKELFYNNREKQYAILAAEMFKSAAEKEYPPAQFEYGLCCGDGRGTYVDYEQAVRWHKRAYENGEIRSLTSLGMCYLHGKGVAMDKGHALECFSLAARQGDSEAKYRLSKFYSTHGSENEQETAFSLCTEAADSGHLKAQHLLGSFYEHGVGTEADMVQAVKWYMAASDKGFAIADFALAVCYEKGSGVCKSDEKAFEYYMRAAEKSNSAAMFKVACMYERGKGTEKDIHCAVQWYKMSADLGNYKALHCLGMLYEQGLGVEKNIRTALECYTKASQMGNVRSHYRLALYYSTGIHEPRNPKKAFEYCKLAADSKSPLAQYKLGKWYEKGFIVEQNLKKALQYFREAAAQGHSAAIYSLGVMNAEGKGVAKNISEAIELFHKAAELGFAPAFYRLGLCHEIGYGVSLDLSTATAFFEKAYALGYEPAGRELQKMFL
ncbi:MAG: sel1 repeat family protein [Clostridia bacterium]|nr:sel1 repeat family protein [Clostridia bacterium]